MSLLHGFITKVSLGAYKMRRLRLIFFILAVYFPLPLNFLGAQVTEIRALDGAGKNLLHPLWEQAGQPLTRVGPATYADGMGALVHNRLNPRSPSDQANISIPPGDPVFQPGQALLVTRSQDQGGSSSPREQINNISAYRDANMVFGGRANEGDGMFRANWLRSFETVKSTS